MQRLAGRAVFTVGPREYRWEDVILAAHLWNEIERLERPTREGIACRRRLEDRGEALTETEIEGAADAWRYERDLLSADDLQEWLTARGIVMDEWLQHIDRLALRTRWSDELDDILKAYKVSAADVDAVVYVEAVCSAGLSELAETLAGQAAVHDRLGEESRTGKTSTKAARKAVLDRLPARVRRGGVIGVAPAATIQRADLVADVMLSFDRFVDQIAAPAALEREIEAHVLDWTRLDCQTRRILPQEAAREAVLLVQEDGLTLTEAAKVASSVIEDARYVLEEVEPPLKDRLVGALPGELIGPLASDNGSLASPSSTASRHRRETRSISDRARDRIIRRTIRREVSRRVRWHERF